MVRRREGEATRTGLKGKEDGRRLLRRDFAGLSGGTDVGGRGIWRAGRPGGSPCGSTGVTVTRDGQKGPFTSSSLSISRLPMVYGTFRGQNTDVRPYDTVTP